ncbi:hypothetical protein SCLCIDRAFT_30312 [Scleroderma citrinum Foug A]|uniref:Uncharacterized protein n=1 Tax=Scleroderma citrinum Foug A TaxID=1036808 RepID=A0A0C2ZSH2_9AGAM|nr:hypothetical protein SCLCIDRAFT_30312 [Scleroderma citrinum Foug A]
MIKRRLEMVEDARHHISRRKCACVQNSEPPCMPSLLDQQPDTPSDKELLHMSDLFKQQPNPTYEEPPHDHPHQHLDPSNNKHRNLHHCLIIGLHHLLKIMLTRNYCEGLIIGPQHLQKNTLLRNHHECLVTSLRHLQKISLMR